MHKKLIYITYQTFPADTANSIQTMTMLKYFSRSEYKVQLIFPNRSENSTNNLAALQKFYGFDEHFDIKVTEHNYPFKDYKGKTYFKKIRFHISHFLWSKKNVNQVLKDNPTQILFFTRSDWVFYFLSKKNKSVTFECHQVSRIRRFVLSRCIKNKNSKIIFTNELLKKAFFRKNIFDRKIMVAENAFDDDHFKKNINKVPNKVIFVGNLLRFNQDRGLDMIIQAFNDPRLSKHTLEIIGGPERVITSLKKKIISNNIYLIGRKSHKETIERLQSSEIGLLVNSSSNKHSTHHTSPLKFFEYLRSELKVVAIDFPAHRNLPYSEQITYYKETDRENLICSIIEASNLGFYDYKNLNMYSYLQRAMKILNFMARPEGLEPPTL